MNKRRILLVYDCDDWKSYDSMRLAFATTSVRRWRSFIISKIERGDFVYGDPEDTAKKQSERFKEHFDVKPLSYLDGLLKFGFLDYVYDGEEI